MNAAEIFNGAVCPKCRQTIEFRNEILFCKPCGVNYPSLDGIPWLFKDPQATLTEWKNRFDFYIQYLMDEANRIENESREAGLFPETAARLKLAKDLRIKQVQLVRDLLSSLGLLARKPKELHQGFQTELPQGQQLGSYYANIHRDWVWGDEENRASLEIIKKTAGEKTDLGRTVILGGGACRLPYDIHHAYNLKDTLVVDINPLLFLAAKKITEGKAVELVEFPLAPLDAKNTAVLQSCRAPASVKDGFHFLFSDATDLPFKPGTFDTVITPWLADIVPQEPSELFKRFNHSIKNGGRWIYFGSIAFNHKNFSKKYHWEEVLSLISASGFKIEKAEQQRIPYLQSPHSRHGRVENVVCIVARKTADATQPKPYHFVPDWISDSRKAVPHLDYFKSQTFITKVQFEVLSLVDGKRSIAAIAALVATHYKMTQLEAEEAVRTFLTKVFEQNIFDKI